MSEFSNEQLQEIHCLALFDLNNSHEGLKIHNTANVETISAAKRLYKKGLITRDDGGYLTSLGKEAAEFMQRLRSILRD